MLRKNITGAKYYSDELHQMTNLNIATPIDKNDINFGQSDILLAKDIIKLTSNAGAGDISEIKTSLDTLNKKVEQNSGNIAMLNSKFTGLFEVVNTLPNIDDAQSGKIYCIKDVSSTDTKNKYTEWVKIQDTDGAYKFEKVGEFNTAPDLSGYVKLTEIGLEESFIFTLEDGSKVTKSIRVVSTTNN